MTQPANFTALRNKAGGVFAFSGYDPEFVAAVKALGAKFARNDAGRAFWHLAPAQAAGFDAFRAACEAAKVRAAAKVEADRAKADAAWAAMGDKSVEAGSPFPGLRGWSERTSF